MTEKPYGLYTLEQLKQIVYLVRKLPKLTSALKHAFHEADPQRRKEIVGDSLSWCHYYEMPYKEHLRQAVLIIGLYDQILVAERSDDPVQSMLDACKNRDPDKIWEGGYHGKYKERDLVAVVLSLMRTVESIMVYQKSLSTLIDEVRSNPDNTRALFYAISIDRTVVSCPSITHRIALAELQYEQGFFRDLKKALDGPSLKYSPYFGPLRYMLYVLVEAGMRHLSSAKLETLLVNELNLYHQHKSGAPKALRKHYDAAKAVNPLK